MTPRVRDAMLTAHVTTSVGFLGAIVTFFALAIVGASSDDPEKVRAAYLAMNLSTWLVIVPLCVAAFLSGLIQSLATPWGLFRHYWILVKLLLTIVSAVVLVVHTRPIGLVAQAAAAMTLAPNDLHGVRLQLIVASAAAVVVALCAVTLSIFKPQGMTRYGWCKQQSRR